MRTFPKRYLLLKYLLLTTYSKKYLATTKFIKEKKKVTFLWYLCKSIYIKRSDKYSLKLHFQTKKVLENFFKKFEFLTPASGFKGVSEIK